MSATSEPDRGAREAALFRPAARAVQAGQLRGFAFGRGRYPGHRLRAGHLPGVDVVGFWDAAFAQTWGIGWHRNEGIELMYQESGSVGFVVGGQQFQLKPGDVTFTRPWQQHQVGNPYIDAGRLHFLILDVGVRRPHQTWRCAVVDRVGPQGSATTHRHPASQ